MFINDDTRGHGGAGRGVWMGPEECDVIYERPPPRLVETCRTVECLDHNCHNFSE